MPMVLIRCFVQMENWLLPSPVYNVLRNIWFYRQIPFAVDMSSSDGTSIITGCIIEEQPVICEWTENELQRYFGVTETKEYGDGTAFAMSSDSEFSREDPPVPYVRCQEKPRRISIADGFVSILLTFRMEHKDYATVCYDQSAVSCTLSMPDNLRVSIERRGHYEVSINDEVNLKVIKVARTGTRAQ